MRILTREATVKTASVEMKVLSISGKQMTLAVYRQLDEEEIIDEETGKLKGVPWGRVNYFWGKCEPDHLHIVWQKGEELRRACVHKAHWFRDTKAFRAFCELACSNIYLYVADGGTLERVPSTGEIPMSWGGYRTYLEQSDLIRKALNGEIPWTKRPEGFYAWSLSEREVWEVREREKSKEEAKVQLRNIAGPLPVTQDDVLAMARALDNHREQRKVSFATLEASDLLLIAV